jgi:hypothetical protein
MRQSRRQRLEATLQRVLSEYPDDALERMREWAAHGRLAHSWDSCLNAAAVGHDIVGPTAVEAAVGVPSVVAEFLAYVWDTLGEDEPGLERTRQIVGEILASRRRCTGSRTVSGFGGGAPIPDVVEPSGQRAREAVVRA